VKGSIYAIAAVLLGVNISYAEESALDSLKTSVQPSVLSETAVPEVSKWHIAADDPAVSAPKAPVEWVVINGGKFMMGTDDPGKSFKDAKPIREVAVKTFEMSKTAVTVEQYAECVNKGKCDAPHKAEFPEVERYCNYWQPGRRFHPVNCVSWYQANQYAKFMESRLPSEAEWEYAATSGGKDQKYPWGNEEPSCDKAVMYGKSGFFSASGWGCGKESTWPVCSKPAGNTAQGLCDMAGNVLQWVQDSYRDSYEGAPVDGSAFDEGGSPRVLRGGAFMYDGALNSRADHRSQNVAFSQTYINGIRLARSR